MPIAVPSRLAKPLALALLITCALLGAGGRASAELLYSDTAGFRTGSRQLFADDRAQCAGGLRRRSRGDRDQRIRPPNGEHSAGRYVPQRSARLFCRVRTRECGRWLLGRCRSVRTFPEPIPAQSAV